MSSAYENSMTNQQAENYTQEYPVTVTSLYMQESEYMRQRAEAAEARAARLQAERDSAAYQATCEAARAVYDVAQVYKDAGDRIEYSALIQAFNKICEALK